MTKTDLARLFGRIAATWTRFEPAAQTVKAWLDPLNDITLDQAEKALEAYAKTGKDFPPTAYQILEFVPRNAKREAFVKPDPDYARRWLERYFEEGFVVVGEDIEGGFAWSLRRKSHAGNATLNRRTVCGIPVTIYQG